MVIPQEYTVNKPDLRAPLIAKLRRGVGISWIRVITLVVLDSLMLSAAWFIAVKIGTPVNSFNLLWSSAQQSPGLLVAILTINLGILAASGLYGTDDKRRSFLSLIKAITLAQVVLLSLAFFYQPGEVFVSRSAFLIAWLLALVLVFGERLLLHAAVITLRRQGTVRNRVFLIGKPEDTAKARKIIDKLAQCNVLGESNLSTSSTSEQWNETLEKIVELGTSEVFICSWQSVKNPIFLFWQFKNAGNDLRLLPIGMEFPSQWSEIKMVDGLTTLRFRAPSIIGSDFWTKRCFDLIASLFILVLISPVLITIAIAIKLDSPGPVFYKQARVGLKGRTFKVWKFRTMVVNAAELQKELEAKNEMKGGVLFKMKDDPRVTKVGKFLRRYSLDELPQLINVLLGQMSLVGPRPLPLRDVERFAEHHTIRHEVLPGITGLWQVSGRSDVEDSEEVFRLDMAYIQNWSLALDFHVLLQTVRALLGREGAY